MPIIQPRNRKPTNQLGDLLTTLYDILLLCETEEKLICNKTQSPKWAQFVKSNQVSLIHSHKVKDGVFKLHKTDNEKHLVLNGQYVKQDITDTIVFVNKKNYVFSSLFSHIRNAFAHNQIFVEGEYVIMYDRLKPESNAFTMIAHVKIEVLKELIKTIKELKE